MKKMHPHLRLLRYNSLAVCLLLSSCVSSVNPISSPKTAKPDLALVGEWTDQNSNQPGHSRIYVTHTPWMRAVSLDAKGKAKNGAGETIDFFTSTLGKDTFLNCLSAEKAHNEPFNYYTFYRYEISEGHILHLWSLSEKPVIKAIRSGRLKGTITGKTESVLIEDSSEKIQAFILRSNAHKLFNEEVGVIYRK